MMSANLILFHPKTMGLLQIPTILLLLLTLPRVIAQIPDQFTYPDGSFCWRCTPGDGLWMYGSKGQCSTDSIACGGSKVPDGYVMETTANLKGHRYCISFNGCIHLCTLFSETGVPMLQACCFKEGSPVRSLLFSVRGAVEFMKYIANLEGHDRADEVGAVVYP